MRSLPTLAVLPLLVLASGCAHSVESVRQERTVVAVDAPSTTVITETPPTVIIEQAPVRPRLSQVVTLGQGANEASYDSAAPAQSQGAAAGSNVVVNNNITVVNGQPIYGGYGYGYGAGGAGYGARDGYGRSSSSSRQAWAPTGWEGAQRTARPGATPAVGGNWAPAQSHGPAQLK